MHIELKLIPISKGIRYAFACLPNNFRALKIIFSCTPYPALYNDIYHKIFDKYQKYRASQKLAQVTFECR